MESKKIVKTDDPVCRAAMETERSTYGHGQWGGGKRGWDKWGE